jgi:hypothetical protein
MLFLLILAAIGLHIGKVEDTVWVRAVDAFGGEGLYAVEDAILKRDAGVECVEFFVVVADDIRIGEVDGEDADALGSCATRRLAISDRPAMEVVVVVVVVVTYSFWGARGDCDYTEATGMQMRLQPPRMLERWIRARDSIQ